MEEVVVVEERSWIKDVGWLASRLRGLFVVFVLAIEFVGWWCWVTCLAASSALVNCVSDTCTGGNGVLCLRQVLCRCWLGAPRLRRALPPAPSARPCLNRSVREAVPT